MNKELTPLEALKEIRYMLEAPYTSSVIKQGLDIIETALKDSEKQNDYYAKLLESVLNDKEHKALEILKQFDAFRIIQIQGQWFVMMGDVFVKAPKIPITEEQASLLMEALK